MVGDGDIGLGDVLGQLLLHAQRGGAARPHQPQPMAHAEDVRVYRHGGLVEHDRLDDVGRFASHAGQLDEFLQRVGHLAVEVLDEHLRHAHQMAGLVVGVGHAADVFEHHLGRGGGKRFGGGEVVEEWGSDHVDTLVRALRRQDDGDEQLEGVVVVQLRFGHGPVLPEPGQYLFVSFFLSHLSLLR